MSDTDPQKLAQACADRMWNNDNASKYMGMQIDMIAPGKAIMSMTVRLEMVNGHGICHGGYIFSLADSAFAFACNTHGEVTVAQHGAIDFVRPAKSGDRLTATATEVSRGRRVGVYDVSVHRSDGKLVAVMRGNSYSTGVSSFENDDPENEHHA